MAAELAIYHAESRSILSATTGFIREAGFTHSLTPARNCTYGCTYCYVPTLRIFAGLKPDDWRRWGAFTTFKSNAAELLKRELRGNEIIYCSPMVDPYQPAEREARLMPRILQALLTRPPKILVVQTRGPMILRDIAALAALSREAVVRVSFSVTTNREQVRRWYEPHCATFEERLSAIRGLRAAGIEVFATLAPLLPCDPEILAEAAMEASGRDPIGDPLHVRAVKPRGATTREEAWQVSRARGFEPWHDPEFQEQIVARIRHVAPGFRTGPEGFSQLVRPHESSFTNRQRTIEPAFAPGP